MVEDNALISLEFSKESIQSIKIEIQQRTKSEYWPVLYIIYKNGEKVAYIGETCDPFKRLNDHLKNPDRRKLNKALILADPTFNKSVILDYEQQLIRLFSAEEYKLVM